MEGIVASSKEVGGGLMCSEQACAISFCYSISSKTITQSMTDSGWVGFEFESQHVLGQPGL
jgi:hypothetical protein